MNRSADVVEGVQSRREESLSATVMVACSSLMLGLSCGYLQRVGAGGGVQVNTR